ncbi:transcription antitermination factor NusB [Congregibacter litoralis]|uniref:Transcription antitermination protein NusB n=1 Tax=Congregibacter litoralis KT71 TaxID=314285 RepID=A4A6E2_9GAMM|nr:transcription antitermination factor NusB [Congregibacter litoralis]EAQ98589.1 NusB antitermination factor [Congregibacter litoralis KT71]
MSKQAQQELVARRRKARHYALQALYQWHMAGATATDIEAEFRTDYDFSVVDLEYFQALIHGVPPLVEELDSLLEPLLDREIRELDPIERSLLRMGGFELRDRIDVPYRVVINESVALAKKFGAAESYKYINGVLDKLARQLRGPEVSAGR